MYYTHINRNVIDSNRKNGTNDPPIKFQKGKYGKGTYCHEASLPPGSRIAYDNTGTILPCGARLVIVSDTAPTILK